MVDSLVLLLITFGLSANQDTTKFYLFNDTAFQETKYGYSVEDYRFGQNFLFNKEKQIGTQIPLSDSGGKWVVGDLVDEVWECTGDEVTTSLGTPGVIYRKKEISVQAVGGGLDTSITYYVLGKVPDYIYNYNPHIYFFLIRHLNPHEFLDPDYLDFPFVLEVYRYIGSEKMVFREVDSIERIPQAGFRMPDLSTFRMLSYPEFRKELDRDPEKE